MPRRLTNRMLLGLVALAVATGWLGWALREPETYPLYALHRAAGVGLIALLLWKQAIVRSSLRRRFRGARLDRSALPGLVGGATLLVSLGFGLAWTLQAVPIDALPGYSPLTVHVLLALVALPILAVHLARRWERGPSPRHLATRRNLLHLAGLSALWLAGWQLTERAASALAERGARRPSGSRHVGSFAGNDFPVTSWTFDSVPQIDPASWQLRIVGNVGRPTSFTYADLLERTSLSAAVVLDCTGGWWTEQWWSGAPAGDLLDAAEPRASARWAEVVSATGHRWTVALGELRSALVATHVGGEPLSPGHGFPARLVAPGRRGFQWVKWIDRLEVL